MFKNAKYFKKLRKEGFKIIEKGVKSDKNG